MIILNLERCLRRHSLPPHLFDWLKSEGESEIHVKHAQHVIYRCQHQQTAQRLLLTRDLLIVLLHGISRSSLESFNCTVYFWPLLVRISLQPFMPISSVDPIAWSTMNLQFQDLNGSERNDKTSKPNSLGIVSIFDESLSNDLSGMTNLTTGTDLK